MPELVGKFPAETLKLEFERAEPERELDTVETVLEDVVYKKLASDIISSTPTLRSLLLSHSSEKKLIKRLVCSNIDRNPEFSFLEAGSPLT